LPPSVFYERCVTLSLKVDECKPLFPTAPMFPCSPTPAPM